VYKHKRETSRLQGITSQLAAAQRDIEAPSLWPLQLRPQSGQLVSLRLKPNSLIIQASGLSMHEIDQLPARMPLRIRRPLRSPENGHTTNRVPARVRPSLRADG
jgi:hypothetical protein